MLGIDPQKGRTYGALTDSGLVVAAEAEAVSDETGGRIRLKSGCPAWQRRVSGKVEGWESGDDEVSIMVGGFCGQSDNDTHVEMGMTHASRSTADHGVDTGRESKLASEQSLTQV